MKKSAAQLNHDISVYLGEPEQAPRRARTSPCTPRLDAAGYLVQTSYRVPPFLVDDVLWVHRRDSGPRGRVFCVASDMVWYERIPERSGWLDLETLTPHLATRNAGRVEPDVLALAAGLPARHRQTGHQGLDGGRQARRVRGAPAAALHGPHAVEAHLTEAV